MFRQVKLKTGQLQNENRIKKRRILTLASSFHHLRKHKCFCHSSWCLIRAFGSEKTDWLMTDRIKMIILMISTQVWRARTRIGGLFALDLQKYGKTDRGSVRSKIEQKYRICVCFFVNSYDGWMCCLRNQRGKKTKSGRFFFVCLRTVGTRTIFFYCRRPVNSITRIICVLNSVCTVFVFKIDKQSMKNDKLADKNGQKIENN